MSASVAGQRSTPLHRARLALIGGFSLDRGGEELRLPGSVQRLVAYLALQERPVPRQRIAFTLWPEASERHANGSLRAGLFRLRSSCREGILADGLDLGLDARVEVDVRRVRALVDRTADTDNDELEVMLRGGELLPDWYDDWVLVERERFHELRGDALEALSERHLSAGLTRRAREAALEAVRADPMRESSRRALIRAHLEDGNRAAAVAHYRQFAVLLQQFGLSPSPQLEELVHNLAVQ